MPGGKLNWVVLALTAVTFLACADAAGADVAFTAATNIATSANNPTQIATADFNNDGLADLASADCADRCGSVPAGGIGSAAVLLGNGAGGFSAAPGTPLTPPAGMEGPDVLTAADFDDNGRTDVAVLYNLTNEEAVYLGRKSSTNLFQTPIDEGTDGGGTEGTAAGDIDGDGKLDLVVARGASGMAVRLGDGTGNLAAPSAVIPGTNGSPIAPENVALADLDLDGDLDAVAGLLGGGILVLRNSPIGTFTVVDRIGAGDSGRDIDVGDMNEDGRPDVILSAEGHSVSVLLGRSGLDFDPPVTFPSSGGDVEEAVVADFTGDRHLDVAVRTDVAATAVDVFQGDGRGSLARVATLASSTSEDGQVGIAAPDVNGDGAPDIVATNSTNHGLSLYRNLPIAAVGSADFDDTATGARSLERTIEVRNRGAAPLAITAANITGANAADFTKTSDGCTSVTLPRNGTCEVTVRFVPTTAGSRAATLTIDPAEPALSNVSGALTGRGVAPPPAPAAGPQGPAGPAGADGADGADGANGAPGAQGPAGPAGQQGATGQQGAQGPAGPQGPAGRDATVTCKPGKAKKGKVKVTCTVRLAARAKRLAKLVRRGKVYAVGRSNGSRGSLRLKPRRRITRGTYTLLVKITGSDGESVTLRQRVMVR